MGDDEARLVRLWREKRGEVEPEDLSDNLIVQLGPSPRTSTGAGTSAIPARPSTTYRSRSSIRSSNGWRRPWMGSSNPRRGVRGQIYAALVRSRRRPPRRSIWPSCSTICGSSNARSAVLSIITGGGKWVELTVHADPLYQHLLLTAERKFWRCVQDGETPRLSGSSRPGRASRRFGSSI